MRVVLAVAGTLAVRETLRDALDQDDLVLVEQTTAAALRRLAAFQVDVIIVEDTTELGLAVVPALRSVASQVPLALLTDREDALYQRRVRDAGADSCLHRPPSAGEIDRLLHLRGDVLPPEMKAAPALLDDPHTELLRAHDHVVQWLAAVSGERADVQALARDTVRLVVRAFGAMRCALIWGEGELATIAGSCGYAATVVEQIQLRFSQGLLLHLNRHAAIVRADDEKLSLDTQRELRLLHGQLAAPLLRDGQVMGVLIVAEKAAGGRYRPAEENLIVLLARCLPMLIEDSHTAAPADSGHKQDLDSLINHLSAGLITVGHDRNVRIVNPSAERILGRAAADLVGRDVGRLGSAFAGVAAAAMADGSPRLRQVIQDPLHRGAIGMTASPLNGDGVAVLFSSLPQAVADPAAEELPFWHYLASRLAQEIKNPMVAINTYAQLLPHKFSSVEFRENYASTVQSEIARINRVVELLFAYAEEPQLEMRPVDLAGLLGSILLEREAQWASQGVKVLRDDGPLYLKVQGDPFYLQQACEHLLQNAVEAMPRGGTLEIQIRPARHDAELIIANTGPAIADEDLRRLYLPFFSTKERGMGLGLPLAKRYIEAHGGQLSTAENQPGRVSFSMRLPYSGDSNADPSNR